MLSHLSLIKFDGFTNEDKILKKLNRPYKQEFVEVPEVNN